MTETARLSLPLLDAGQAQKEITVNEALQRLDLLAQARVVAVGLNTPPTAPQEGEAWIVGTAPTGDWAGQAGALAGWTGGGWRFVAPSDGMTVWTAADACCATWTSGAWRLGVIAGRRVEVGGVQVVGARAAAIALPSGGGVMDVEARGALSEVLAVLRGHGLIAT